jgi:hypothetical protein
VKLGLDAIEDFDDGTKSANLAKLTYASIRNDVLRSHPWNFALHRYPLDAEAAVPDGVTDFDHAFKKPNGVLAVHAVEGQSAIEGDEWVIEGEYILCNLAAGTDDEPTLNITCIREITDVLKYDASFIEHLAERLQAEWVEPLRHVTNLQELKIHTTGMKERRAMSNDGKEGTPRSSQSCSFISVR